MPDSIITPAALGRAIRQRRLELSLTQEQLCERMSFDPKRISYISAVENGQYADLKLTRLELFAHALNFSAPDLLLLASRNAA